MTDGERLDRYASSLHRAEMTHMGIDLVDWVDVIRLFPDDVKAYRAMARAAMAIADEERAEG